MTLLQTLHEDIDDFLTDAFGDAPLKAMCASDIKEFVVNSVKRYFGESGVEKITKEIE
jgi:hypothetical protein